ncbi:carbohydrate ABC transporter permease [Alicyclobacillus fastidiosus]|uniref:Carbohydrate ABC transporter permease n=1 Tax=Alicyclobacillus fastidiosus TaxID=392011 RepID=A0ABV5A947_9BACL|nr:carbohydrate ABC transporter permease [Alicyclobacillus fastidiosus]WEH10670.1 carbohydrate ABC transporter permease [Alicyclobacillus fastidiosus]
MKTIRSFMSYGLLILLSLAIAAPLILLIFNSFKTESEFQANPFGLPTTWTFTNIASAWVQGNYAHAYLNTFIVAAVTIVVVLFSSGLGAYALATLRFKWSTSFMAYLLFTMMVPSGMFLVPIFFMWQRFHLMNTLVGLVIVYCGIFMAFNVFLIRSYFVNIPMEIRESGLVDGASEFSVFFRIFVPMSKPVFFTAALILVVWTWNEFFYANALLLNQNIKTVSLSYLAFTGRFTQNWTLISAGGLISILPILILYLFLQRRFIQGILEGSLK